MKNHTYRLILTAIFCYLIICPFLYAQSKSETEREAYRFLETAQTLKNKDKNCAAAIESYEKSLAVKDFRQPNIYRSIASCYAQIGNREKALLFLEKMLSIGWINDEDIRKDEELNELLGTLQGKKFLAKVERKKADLIKELSPASYGISKNAAWQKIENWRKDTAVSGEDFFRLVANFNEFPQPKKTGVFVKLTNRFSEKIEAPFYVYIPSGYDSRKAHSLLIYSPGGWYQRKEFARDEAKEFVYENPVLPSVEKENFIEIFPAGNNSVGTYQFEGIENIRQILAKVKQLLNVDDNRVYMMGFSDGGTGTFRTAVFMPTSYAAFYAVNGRPFTGNRFVNMSNRPFYSLSADADRVFEIQTTRSFFDFAKSVGADWTYREIAGVNHYYLPYLEEYLPAIFSHMKTNSRRVFSNKLNWETSWAPIGKIDWLEISEVDIKRPRADWHRVYEYQRKSSEGNETVKIGDESASVQAEYHNNIFEVKTSCVAKFTLNLHPTMIDFSQPVKVIVNGKEAFNRKVKMDKAFMSEVFKENADRSLLWANRILIEIEK